MNYIFLLLLTLTQFSFAQLLPSKKPRVEVTFNGACVKTLFGEARGNARFNTTLIKQEAETIGFAALNEVDISQFIKTPYAPIYMFSDRDTHRIITKNLEEFESESNKATTPQQVDELYEKFGSKLSDALKISKSKSANTFFSDCTQHLKGQINQCLKFQSNLSLMKECALKYLSKNPMTYTNHASNQKEFDKRTKAVLKAIDKTKQAK